jgi:hypothetical protein
MDKKKRIIQIMEVYLNELKLSFIEDIYGKGTKIKIKNINEVLTTKSLMVDVVVTLGEVINEEILDTSAAEVIIEDMMTFFYPEYKIKTIVSWDC